MESQTIVASRSSKLRRITQEMEALFQRQIELMKSETFVGLTPVQRQEYEKITEKISSLFRELARLKVEKTH